MTYFEFQQKFSTTEQVIAYYLSVRYPKGVKCNHCNSEQVYPRSAEPRQFDCEGCKNSFSIFTGTIFQHSSTDLRKWMYTFHIFLNGKKGISGLQLQREIGVTYKTAWRMLKQIRLAMGNQKTPLFEAIVEIDETYVGGKPRKTSKKDNDKKNPRGRGTKKTPVVGIVSRDTKQVYARVALPNREGKKLTGKQLLSIIDEACATNATVISDEFKSYRILESARSNRFHVSVNHSVTYGTKDIHTNNIESFWATLKRGVFGIYHHVSVKYLQNYVNEFSFRYNNRKTDIFNVLMAQTIGA
jgi:transposase-like protein